MKPPKVGGCSYRESLELAYHAESLGVAGIGCLPSLFPRPGHVDDLVTWCRNIAGAAPNTPFFYYHIPHMSAVNLSMPEFLEKGARQIPTLAGENLALLGFINFILFLCQVSSIPVQILESWPRY